MSDYIQPEPNHRHKADKPSFIRQAVDHTVEQFHGEPRNYSGPEKPPVIYGYLCKCTHFMAVDLCSEEEAIERAKRWNAEHVMEPRL